MFSKAFYLMTRQKAKPRDGVSDREARGLTPYQRLPRSWPACFLLGMFLSFILSAPVSARDEVRSSDRLNLLRQTTTGQASSRTSYQARLDAILDYTPDAAKTVTAAQDALDAAAITAGPVEEEPLIGVSGTASLAEEQKRAKEKEKEATKATKNVLESRLDATEEAHQKQIQDTYEDIEKQKEESSTALSPPSSPQPQEEAVPSAKSSLRPSLANNPFYFAPEDQKAFEEDKPIIISRLVQAGVPKSDAESLVSNASGPDEIIMELMQQEDYAYGEAADLVRTS